MNFYRQIIIFILTWLILPITMSGLEIPFKNLLLIGIPIIFSFYSLIKGLFEKNSKSANGSFYIALLYILIAIKIEYHIYNFLLHLIFIIFGYSIFSSFQNVKLKKARTLGFSLLVINMLLLLTSNSWILGIMNSNKINWTENLEWANFQGVPENDSKMDAIISSGINNKVNYLYNYPPAVFSVNMDPKESWVKNIKDLDAKTILLNHEQGHFNITEAHKRFAQDSINNIWGKSPEKIKEVIEFYINQNNTISDKYDLETEHGSNLDYQSKWDISIEKWLD